jgi:hypothetical protein
MNTAIHFGLPGYGFGLGASGADTAVQIGTTVAQAVVPKTLGSTVAGLLGMITTTVAIPLIGAAIAGISLGIEAILQIKYERFPWLKGICEFS